MKSRRIAIQHNKVIRLNPAQDALDLSRLDDRNRSVEQKPVIIEAPIPPEKVVSTPAALPKHHLFEENKPQAQKKPLESKSKLPKTSDYSWGTFVSDIREFWKNSYGTIRIYLTPEEASKERLLFLTSLLSLFIVAVTILGVTQAMRFVHVSHAEQTRLQTLPATLSDIVANKRVTELPEVFTSINDFLLLLDKTVAPGMTDLHANGSMLHQVSLLRQSARSLTEAGIQMTPVITAAVVFAQDFKDMPQDDLRIKYGSLTSYMELQWKQIKEHVYPELRIAQSKLDQIEVTQLPKEVQKEVLLLRSSLGDIVKLIATVDEHMPAIMSLLGADTPRNYAILLQNSGEMRATGGFIGSMAMIKFNDGWIEYLRFRDVYDVDGQIFDDVPPPPGIETISRSFRLRDSNYWPDFPTSAKQAAWFLDKDKGPGIDGVFAISDELIVRLLAITGPVGFEGLNTPVTAENFMTIMSFLVESKQDISQPKSVVFRFSEAFVPQLMESLMNKPESISVFAKSISERLILGYAFDPAIQSFLSDAGLSGALYVPPSSTPEVIMDYFMPVFTATGGNKSDRYIEQQITHDSRFTDDGLLQDQVTLTRKHLWNGVIEEQVRSMVREATGLEISDRVLEILGGERNRQYVRFFVPKGATLQTVEGIDRSIVKVSEDLGMTVFGFEMSVPMGEEVRISMTYTLPNDMADKQEMSYFLVLQKQPGGDAIPVTKTMTATKNAVVMADTNGYSVMTDDEKALSLDIKPQEISLENIWHGGYLLRRQ